MSAELRYCPKCERYLPESYFGVNRTRADGLNRYNRSCIRRMVNAAREGKRIYDKAIKKKPVRKPSLIRMQPLWCTQLSPRDRVLTAIKRGATTQGKIVQLTRLSEDAVANELAGLWDEGKLNLAELKKRIYKLAA